MNSSFLFHFSCLQLEASKLLLTGLVLLICAVIFQLIGLASPYWISIEILGLKAHSGLWKYCAIVKLLDIDECADYVIIPGMQLFLIL